MDAQRDVTRRNRELRDLPARRPPGPLGCRASSVLPARAARERAARGERPRRGGDRGLGRERGAEPRDLLPAEPRHPPGLHRRTGDRRPRGDAERDAGPGRRPGRDQPGDPGRARDRPLGAGRRVRHPPGLRPQRRARVRAQPRALRLPALGPAVAGRPEGRPARHRHRPPGQPRVPRPRGRVARRPGVPGHAGRDRLAHDDGQRPRRARLGRRRDRGRGGDARRGALDARPAGGRLPPDRRLARGRDGDRPRPDGDRDPAEHRRGREVRRVLRPGSPLPLASRPRHDREHVAGVRRDLRLLPGGRRHAPVPAADRPAGRARRAGRGLLQGEHALARGRGPPHVLAGGRARPRHRRAEPGRPAAPAGPSSR